MTQTNKERIKKQFIFLEEVDYKTSYEMYQLCNATLNRYKSYNNVIMLDFDKVNNCYIYNKSRNVTLKLDTIKGTLQDGTKIDYVGSW